MEYNFSFDDNKILSELIQMKVEALFKKYGLIYLAIKLIKKNYKNLI